MPPLLLTLSSVRRLDYLFLISRERDSITIHGGVLKSHIVMPSAHMRFLNCETFCKSLCLLLCYVFIKSRPTKVDCIIQGLI